MEMQDNRFFIVAVLLIFSTSFNLVRCSAGQHFKSARDGQKLKTNDRRSSGLVPYPRIGRNAEITGFPRTERAWGMINIPRVGRSATSSLRNLNRFYDLLPDADIELYALHDMDPENLLDLDYEEYANRPTAFKYADKMQKDDSWLMSDHVHGYKDRFVQRINDPLSYYSVWRGSRNTQGQGGGYTPRLGRENEHDASFL